MSEDFSRIILKKTNTYRDMKNVSFIEKWMINMLEKTAFNSKTLSAILC